MEKAHEMTEEATSHALAAIPTAGRGLVRLALLGVEGVAAGRDRFERLVQATVGSIYPNARAIRPDPGDWGIDTYVGQLSSGTVSVWQSKYFPASIDDSQRRQIRESFKSIRKHAELKGFAVDSWTLVVPIELSGDETKWWENWSKKQRRETGIPIELLTGPELELTLLKPDLAPVRQQFFGVSPGEQPVLREVAQPEDPADYDEALFVAQMKAAGISVDGPARTAFFNADALARDIQAREIRAEVAALRDVSSNLHLRWHSRFESERAEADSSTNRLPRLFPRVMEEVERYHANAPSLVLRDSLTHRVGFVHHLVEDGQAGWVSDFERIRDEHQGAQDG
jgi:hypothetical protein